MMDLETKEGAIDIPTTAGTVMEIELVVAGDLGYLDVRLIGGDANLKTGV